MANYRQISTHLWMDDKFLQVSPQARLLFLWMFTNPDAKSSGLFLFNDDVCQNETGLSGRELHHCLKELIKIERVVFDDKVNMIWVINQFKHVFKSPKIIESTLREVNALPKSNIKENFFKKYELELIPYDIKTKELKTDNPMRKQVTETATLSRKLVNKFVVAWFKEYKVAMMLKNYYYKRMYDGVIAYSYEDIEGAIDNYFASSDKFITNSKHSFPLFMSGLDRHIADGSKSDGRRGRTR